MLTFLVSNSVVKSTNYSPIGNLGENVVLSCFIPQSSQSAVLVSDVSIIWTKTGLSGVVYEFQKGAPMLTNQSPEFRDRAQVSTEDVAANNASLLLKSVRLSDNGEYSCSVSTTKEQGKISLSLRIAAFSAPNFTKQGDILTAEAQQWFPKPNVSWLNKDGITLKGNTTLFNDSAGIFRLVSTLQPVRTLETYNCLIQNPLVRVNAQANITDTEISEMSVFIFDTASPALITSHHLTVFPALLWIYCHLV